VLEVGGGFAIGGDDGPAVGELAHLGAPHVDHRLDGDGHAGLELGLDFAAIIGDVRLLMEGAPDAVTDELADDAVAVGDNEVFDGLGDVVDAIAGVGLLNADGESFLRFGKEPHGGGRDVADGDGGGGVADPAAEDDADVELDDVGVLDAASATDTMDDFVVDRDTDVAGEPAIMEEGAASAPFVDEARGELVDLAGGDTGHDGEGDFLKDFAGGAATGAHALDFVRGFDGNAH